MLKEVKHKDDNRKQSGIENQACDAVTVNRPTTSRSLSITSDHHHDHEKTPCLVDFFNPIVAVNCIKVIVRKRLHNARRVVILLLVLYFIATGPAFGELMKIKYSDF